MIKDENNSSDITLLPFAKESEIEVLNYTVPYGVEMINVLDKWNDDLNGEGVVVAVIDTGCDPRHPSLRGQIIGGRNFTNDDGANPDIYEDYQGHGTHVAGIIAGNMDPTGVVGVAPGAKLLILKALGKDGRGNYKWIVDAINYAVSKKVDIISMSLGGPKDTKELHNAILDALDKNIAVVCAAGNKGDNRNPNTHEYDYPGAYEEVIEVGAIDNNKLAATFTNSNEFIDLVAPGVSIISTYKNGGYATLSGTSMAAPHVSGALAILIQKHRLDSNKNITEPELYKKLIENTIPLSMARTLQGNGYLFLKD